MKRCSLGIRSFEKEKASTVQTTFDVFYKEIKQFVNISSVLNYIVRNKYYFHSFFILLYTYNEIDRVKGFFNVLTKKNVNVRAQVQFLPLSKIAGHDFSSQSFSTSCTATHREDCLYLVRTRSGV